MNATNATATTSMPAVAAMGRTTPPFIKHCSNLAIPGILLVILMGYVYVAARYGVNQWGWFGGTSGRTNVKLTSALQYVSCVSLCRLGMTIYSSKPLDWSSKAFDDKPMRLLLMARLAVCGMILALVVRFNRWWRKSGWHMWTSMHYQGSEKYFGVLLLFVINLLCLAYEELK
ncbi:expressed unknown protein [Seminavis robusta]|uniref:Uncharacterized protein n=1 Tax=Seminavis robusta TaxID=568900 RepID=A0A9N8F590_9STRA|nr:expressed unknown protein [Seminavis robusta]|eukprot:Sro3270_g118511.1  (173) ;mRNA; r:32-550